PQLFGDAVVAHRTERRNAPLIAKQHGDPAPFDVDLRQELVGPDRRRAACDDEAPGAAAQRLRDLGGRRLRHLLRGRKNDELAQMNTVTSDTNVRRQTRAADEGDTSVRRLTRAGVLRAFPSAPTRRPATGCTPRRAFRSTAGRAEASPRPPDPAAGHGAAARLHRSR